MDVVIPQIGESITVVFISRWACSPGDLVRAGDALVELDSDKASMEVPSPVDGRVIELLAEEGDEVPVGAVVARIEPGHVASQTPEETGANSVDVTKAGPAARQAAREAGVEIDAVPGTGPGGRVLRTDILRASEASLDSPGGPTAEDSSSERLSERVPMSPLRRTIARRLVEAQSNAAILTTFNEVDMSAVMAFRKRYRDDFIAQHGVKLGFMSFFVKAVVEALKAFPAVNAEIDGTDIIYKHYYNIGVAVSGPKGLVVPVLRDADTLSFAEVEKGINDLAARAGNNTLTLQDFSDGTFTISNGGIFGSMMSTPIINPPQVGILGMHNIIERPIAVAGEVCVRPMMYLALSYDHRIIDGREAVSFLIKVRDLIGAPERILLEV